MSKLLALLAAMLALLSTATHAAPVTFHALMTGAAEANPNNSPGTGEVTVVFDLDAHSMRVMADFAGLLSPTTAAHIHCCTATPLSGTMGVATMTPSFTGFPLGVTSGAMDTTFDMTLAASYNAAFLTSNGGSVTSAELALFNGMMEGRSYFNIHSISFPAGEIRGFLLQVPEPATLALSLIGLAVAGGSARRRARIVPAAA